VPPNAELSGLVTLYNQGRIEDALDAGLSLLAAHAGDPMLNNMVGVLLARLGRYDEALERYGRALELRPRYAEAFNNRGNALLHLGRHDEAIGNYRKALDVMPDYAGAHNNLGNALQETGCIPDAIASFQKALQLKPDYADALNNLGNALLTVGNLQEAATAFARALQLQPGFAQALVGYGKSLNLMGFHRQAVEALERGVSLGPDRARWHNELGNALSDLGRLDAATSSYRKAIELEPGLARAHSNLGNALGAAGRRDEAIASYEEALRLAPELCETHYILGSVKDFSPDDDRIPALRQLLEGDGLSDSDRCYLLLTLGKAHEDIGDVEEACAFYRQGNQLRKDELGYDIGQDRERFTQIRALFEASRGARAEAEQGMANSAPRPVFIVGMPRSGTSLVEQVLAGHSTVHGGGELRFAGRIMAPVANAFGAAPHTVVSAETLAKIRDEYLGEIAHIAGGAPVVTDKMPDNFLWCGFLLEAMPDARIVHVRRDPMATCWSLYKRRFAHCDWSHDLADLGEYYRMYEELMGFWHEAFPGRIYDLGYEVLTEQQEDETRKLLEYCGLPWEDACLEFHTTQRPVHTASTNQVRRKMYTGSSEAWRPFAACLEPLAEILRKNT
jgi:tetratricopeptide (TPR) repeat protein